MNKIGIKILEELRYEQFEALQYLLDFDFEYEDMLEHIAEQKVIELDIEEDEDRAEDLEALKAVVAEFDIEALKYELYSFSTLWEQKELTQLT